MTSNYLEFEWYRLIIECADPQLKLEKVKLHTDEGKNGWVALILSLL